MPRVARIVVPGWPHHLTQRGNNRQPVFFVDDDFQAYLRLLGQHCQAAEVTLLGYCLMPNHVHLLAVPRTESALARAIGRTHHLYTQYVNRLHGRSGHLWQSRFLSCPLDETHVWTALRYVELNPVRAGLSRTAEEYSWSSAAVHVGARRHDDLLASEEWAANWTPKRWRAALAETLSDAELQQIRGHLRTGRPLAGEAMLSKLEHRLGRRLRPLPVGRPKKDAQKEGGRRKKRARDGEK